MKRFIVAGGFALGLALMPGTAGATNDKVSVCHATGSMSNPYVLISVSENAWENGHSDHEGDVLAIEIEVLVDRDDNGRERFETVRFCPGAAPIPGPAGPKGPEGPIGVPGRDGKDGTNGLDGLNGADGKDGTAQHNCAGASGWLYSSDHCRPLAVTGLTGPAGPQGERGEVGPQGPAGGTTVIAANDTSTTTVPAGPAGELAHTGSNAWLIALGLFAIFTGGAFFIVRRFLARTA